MSNRIQCRCSDLAPVPSPGDIRALHSHVDEQQQRRASCSARRPVLSRGSPLARGSALVLGFLYASRADAGLAGKHANPGAGAATAFGPRLPSRWQDARRFDARPPRARRERRRHDRARGPCAVRRRTVQRHGRRCAGTRVRGQFRLRQERGRGAARNASRPRRSGRHGDAGGHRADVPERHGHHAGRQASHRGRDVRATSVDVRYRRPRRPRESPPLCATGRMQSGWHRAGCGRRGVGGGPGRPARAAGVRGRPDRSRDSAATPRRIRVRAWRARPAHAVHPDQPGSGPAMADKRDGRIEAIEVDVPGAGWP